MAFKSVLTDDQLGNLVRHGDYIPTPTQGQLLADTQNELRLAYQLMSVHLQALRIISEALGNPYAGDVNKNVLDLANLAARTIRRTEEN